METMRNPGKHGGRQYYEAKRPVGVCLTSKGVLRIGWRRRTRKYEAWSWVSFVEVAF